MLLSTAVANKFYLCGLFLSHDVSVSVDRFADYESEQNHSKNDAEGD